MSVTKHTPTNDYFEYHFESPVGILLFSVFVNCSKITVKVFFIEFKNLAIKKESDLKLNCESFIKFINDYKGEFHAFETIQDVLRYKKEHA